MQKIVNVVAVSSGVVSLAVVISGVYVYVNRDAIVDGVKSQIMEAVSGSLGGLGGLGGGMTGGALIPEGNSVFPPEGNSVFPTGGGAAGSAGVAGIAPPVIPSF